MSSSPAALAPRKVPRRTSTSPRLVLPALQLALPNEIETYSPLPHHSQHPSRPIMDAKCPYCPHCIKAGRACNADRRSGCLVNVSLLKKWPPGRSCSYDAAPRVGHLRGDPPRSRRPSTSAQGRLASRSANCTALSAGVAWGVAANGDACALITRFLASSPEYPFSFTCFNITSPTTSHLVPML